MSFGVQAISIAHRHRLHQMHERAVATAGGAVGEIGKGFATPEPSGTRDFHPVAVDVDRNRLTDKQFPLLAMGDRIDNRLAKNLLGNLGGIVPANAIDIGYGAQVA